MPRENKIFLYQIEKKPSSSEGYYFNVDERNGYTYDPKLIGAYHWHDYFEMEFFWAGEATHVFNGEKTRIKRGYISLLTPADFHTLYQEPGDKKLYYYNVNFNEYALSSELMFLLTEYEFPMVTVVNEEECEILHAEFSMLTKEYNGSGLLRDKMVKDIFEKIFIIFWRALLRESSDQKRNPPRRDSNVRYIVNYLRIHFREPVSLTEIAKTIHLTPNYIGELFKKETGFSFTDYVGKLRLSYATNLLTGSDLSIADISAQSGFHSVSYFIRNFKLAMGMTPLEYRISEEKKRDK